MSEPDIRLSRVMAEIPQWVRRVCFSSPDGTEAESLGEHWLKNHVRHTVSSEEHTLVDAFLEEHPTTLLMRSNISELGGLMIRIDQELKELVVFEQFLNAAPNLPVVVITTSSHSMADVLFEREDSVILHPESLFFSIEEMEIMCGSALEAEAAWRATGGWPLAFELYQQRNENADRRGLSHLRKISMAMHKWLAGSHPDIRDMKMHLASLPKINSDVLKNLLRDKDLDFSPLKYLQGLGLIVRVPSAGNAEHDWWKMPDLVGEGLQINFNGKESPGTGRIVRESLMALAEAGDWETALARGIELGNWGAVQAIFDEYWAIAVVENSQALTYLLHQFLRIRVDLTVNDDLPYSYVAQFLTAAIEFQHNLTESEGKPALWSLWNRRSNGHEHTVPEALLRNQPDEDTLLTQLVALRVQGYWAKAAEKAEELTKIISAKRVSHTLARTQLAIRGLQWQQIGMAHLLNMNFILATEAFSQGRQIASIAEFEKLDQKCGSLLVLVEGFRSIFGNTFFKITAEDYEKEYLGRNVEEDSCVRDNLNLTKGVRAIWEMDKEGLEIAIATDFVSFEGAELWPLRFFISSMYEVFFGNGRYAFERLEELQGLLQSEPNSLFAWLAYWSEAALYMVEGKSAQLERMDERYGPDPHGILPALKAVAQATAGRTEEASRLAYQLKHSGTRLGSYGILDSVQCFVDEISQGKPVTYELSRYVHDEGSLFKALIPWCMGYTEEHMLEHFRLSQQQLDILKSVGQPIKWQPKELARLSDREIEILKLLQADKKRREIAEELHLSVNTVKSHVHKVYQKLGVTNRLDALDQASRIGYL